MEEKAEATSTSRQGWRLPRLIFLGTSDFACPSLERLIKEGAEILLVVTQPDRPKGRGRRLSSPPVKALALQHGIEVYQPDRIRDSSSINFIRSLYPECLVVVAYGQVIPPELLRPKFGAINLHPSLLPRYRGAAPIQRALLSGDSLTGVSMVLMDEGLDTGPILSQCEIPIETNETFGALHDRLARIGAELLCSTLRLWYLGRIEPIPQDDVDAIGAPPIAKDETRISWELPAERIVNMIRAFDPAPGAYCLFRGGRMKCFRARLTAVCSSQRGGGRILGISEDGLMVTGGDGRVLAIGYLQPAGKKRIPASDFIRGYRILANERLS